MDSVKSRSISVSISVSINHRFRFRTVEDPIMLMLRGYSSLVCTCCTLHFWTHYHTLQRLRNIRSTRVFCNLTERKAVEMQRSIILLCAAVCVSQVIGFSSQIRRNAQLKATTSRSRIEMTHVETLSTILDGSSTLLLNFLQRVDPEQAKGEFFFFFFGGSGALGIGAAQVPKIAAELNGKS
jgi:hypothetical protein